MAANTAKNIQRKVSTLVDNWFANEEFWNTFGDCMFDPDSFRVARDQAPRLIELAGGQNHQILDLGCGPGRHALPLAALGQNVTAVDLTQVLLDQGKAHSAAQGVSVDWIRDDMRSFSRPGAFDLVICMWSSFGYFDDPADDLGVLQRCRENLAPGGTLVLDLVGKEIVCRDLQPVHLTEFDDGAMLIERPVLENNMTVYSNEWTLVRDGVAHHAHWHHQLYSGAEIRNLLTAAGFDNISLYSDLDGSDYTFDAERLMVIAR